MYFFVTRTVTLWMISIRLLSFNRYCYKIPDGYPLDKAAPLLCAGITVYSPMMRHKMNQPGKSLGVIGLGGLGHMAVKFGKAFGLKVTVFSTSESKKEEALNLLRADNFVISSDKQQMMVRSISILSDVCFVIYLNFVPCIRNLEHTFPILCTNYGCSITNMKLVFLLFSDIFLVIFLFASL